MLLAAAALTVGTMVATVGTASATTDPPTAGACDSVAHNVNGEVLAVMKSISTHWNLYAEPASQCSVLSSAQGAASVYIACKTTNVYGNVWDRVSGDGLSAGAGWTSAANIAHQAKTPPDC